MQGTTLKTSKFSSTVTRNLLVIREWSTFRSNEIYRRRRYYFY